MGNSCVVIPKKGASFFKEARSKFGYNTAKELYYLTQSPAFMEKNKKSLRLDSEGFPSLSSLIAVPSVKNYIGNKKILEALNAPYKSLENTLDNYNIIIEQVNFFNTESQYKDNYVASIEKDKGNIRVKISPMNVKVLQKSKEQYAAKVLNKKLENIFKPLGVTVSNLYKAEEKAGVKGITDFSAARRVGEDFMSIIRVANNMEGAEALLEENCHLIIGIRREDPLVQRALSSLLNNEEAVKEVLGSKYENYKKEYSGNKEMLAEEALGHILKNSLTSQEYLNSLPTPSLFSRFKNFILNLFKNYNVSEVQKAINEAEKSISNLANKILNKEDNITEKDIEKARRKRRLYNLQKSSEATMKELSNMIYGDTSNINDEIMETLLSPSDDVGRDIEEKDWLEEMLNDSEDKAVDEVFDIIAEILNAELKKEKMGIDFYSMQTHTKLEELKTWFKSTLRNKDSLTAREGMAAGSIKQFQEYLVNTWNILKDAHALIDDINNEGNDFSKKLKNLTQVRDYVYSIKQLNDVITKAVLNKTKPFFTTPIEDNFYNGHSIHSLSQELDKECNLLLSRYAHEVVPAFAGWLGTYQGENFLTVGNQKIMLEDIVKRARNGDISIVDTWLHSMQDSNDEFLQLVNLITKREKDTTRRESIDFNKRVLEWAESAKELGITSFDWMLERDMEGKRTGKFISKYHYKEMYDALIKDRVAEGISTYNKVVYESWKDKWMAENAHKYENKVYKEKVTSPEIEKLLTDYIQMKSEIDSIYGMKPNFRAIQARKTSNDRVIESIKNPSQIFYHLKKAVEVALQPKTDDGILGLAESNKVTRFDGSEYFFIPTMYTRNLEDFEELSDDLPAALMKYAYSGFNYRTMQNLNTSLEVGRVILLENIRETPEKEGDNFLTQKTQKGMEALAKKYLLKRHTNIYTKYNNYLKNEVFNMYVEDSGSTTIFGKHIKRNKLVDLLLKASTTSQMAFNWASNMANAGTGALMATIETLSGEYFGVKATAMADAIFGKEVWAYLANEESNIQNDKLHLFMEFFDVKLDFSSKIHDMNTKNLINKLVGIPLGQLGQIAGDLWLYNRTAIAYCLHNKVLYEGKEVPLWEVLEIVDTGKKTKKMKIKEGVQDLDGKPIDIFKHTEKIKQINIHLFGAYNKEDSNALNRIALGKLALQYRKFIMPTLKKMYGKRRFNVLLDREDEGYFRTFTGYVLTSTVSLHKNKMSFIAEYRKLSDWEKANIRRAISNLAIFGILSGFSLLAFGAGGDDDDTAGDNVYIEYFVRRLHHEIGFFTPSFTMLSEIRKQIENPIPSFVALDNVINLLQSLVFPTDWNKVITRGPYEGMTVLQKNFYRAPLPIISQYKQIDRFLNDMESSILFYRK